MATYIVDTTEDQTDGANAGGTSLREAVALANATPGADEIRFATGAGEAFEQGGVVRLTLGQIEISDAVTIDGSEAGRAITISGDALGNDALIEGTNATLLDDLFFNGDASRFADNAPRVFDVCDPAAETVLQGLVITGGRAVDDSGGGVRSAAPLTIVNTAIVGNSTDYSGGRISGEAVLAVNSMVAHNMSRGAGSGLQGTEIVLVFSTITDNFAKNIEENWWELHQNNYFSVLSESLQQHGSLNTGNIAIQYFEYEVCDEEASWCSDPIWFSAISTNTNTKIFRDYVRILHYQDWYIQHFANHVRLNGDARGVPVAALTARPDNPALDAAGASLALGLSFDLRGPGFERVVDLPGIGGMAPLSVDLGAYEVQRDAFEQPFATVAIQAAGSGAPGASPRFTVYADGRAIGTGEIANPAPKLGAAAFETFAFETPVAPAKVEIVFENDGAAPDATNLNLRIGEVSFGGRTYAAEEDGRYVRAWDGADIGATATMWWNGRLTLGGEAPEPDPEAVTLRLAGTGDATQAPLFRVLADGVEIGTGAIARRAAERCDAPYETFVFYPRGDAPPSRVTVEFLNDGRTAGGTDLNLFVADVTFGGRTYTPAEDGAYVRAWDGAELGATGAMWWNGRLTFGEEAPSPPHGLDWVQWRVEEGGSGHWYAIVGSDAGWAAARTAAEGLGGHLVTVTSAAEEAFVTGLIEADDQDRILWLGGYQQPGTSEPSGGWNWLTGEPFVSTHWKPGEPNEAGTEDWLHRDRFGWNDTIQNDGNSDGYVVEWHSGLVSDASDLVGWIDSVGGTAQAVVLDAHAMA